MLLDDPKLLPSSPHVEAHPTSIASLCPVSGSSNINIICCWSAVVGNNGRNEIIHGQHHLRNLLVRPQNNSKGCPLALTAKYNGKASHNFDNGPLVSCKVEYRDSILHTIFYNFPWWSAKFLPLFSISLGCRFRNHDTQSPRGSKHRL